MILEIYLYDYKTCKKYYWNFKKYRILFLWGLVLLLFGTAFFGSGFRRWPVYAVRDLTPMRLRIMFYNQSADKQCDCCNYDRHCRKMDYRNFGEGSLCDLK